MSRSIAEHVAEGGRSYSFEFFPPKTDVGEANLWGAINALDPLRPDFVSVTYGAGGSTRERTFAIVREIAAEGLSAAPHLSCIGSTKESIRSILDEYKAENIRRIVALTGAAATRARRSPRRCSRASPDGWPKLSL